MGGGGVARETRSDGTAFGVHEPPYSPASRAMRERIPTDKAHRRVPSEGRDPENTTQPITMRSDHLALRNSALKNRGVNATPSTMIFPASSTSCHEPKVTAPLIVTLPL